MSKVKNGALGTFTKSLGNIVFYKSNGQDLARTKPTQYKDAKTDTQVIQRKSLRIILAFFQLIVAAVKISFPERKHTLSAYNAFVSANLPQAFDKSGAQPVLLYPNIQISKGSLLKPSDASILASSGYSISANWYNNTNNTTGFATDKATLVIYNPVKKDCYVSTVDASRASELLEIFVSPKWAGDTVHGYLAFRNSTETKASDSVYLGSAVVQA
jgi:hypothetical protein